MAKRNAANFPTVSSGRHYKRPPTKAEEFVEYLKSIGFQTPKYTKPEHFEYLFQKNETQACIKFLMSKIKAKNIVDLEEIERFKAAEADGNMLYGKDLADALARNQEKQRIAAEKNEAVIKRRMELQEIITAKMENIARLERLEEQIDGTIAMKKKEKSLEAADEEVWTKKCEFMDTKIESQCQQLSDQVELLNSTVEEMMKRLSLEPNPLSNQIQACQKQKDWTKMLATEEKLMSRIRPLVENYGSGLMTLEHADVDPVMVEEMNNLFNQNIKEIDRLKHVIIYESIRNFELSANLVAQKEVAVKMAENINEAKRIAAQEPVIQKRMLAEIARKKELLKKTFDDIQQQKVDQIKSILSKGLDDEIKVLKDIKQITKTKVDKFFAFVIGILVSQRCRFEFGEFVLKYQAGKGNQLDQHYQRFLQDFKQLNEMQQSLNPKLFEQKVSASHPSLCQVFKKYGIPITALQSHESTWKALKGIQHQLDLDKMKKRDLNEKQVRTSIKSLTEIHKELDQTWNSIRKDLKDNPEEKFMEALEASIAEKENQLTFLALNKDKLREEAINRKRSQIQDINKLLAEWDEEI